MGYRLPVVVVNEVPDFQLFNYAKIGSFALTTNTTRYIPEEHAHEFNNIVETTAFHYRNFVQERSIRYPRKNAPDYPIAYPHYAKPARLPQVVYIDIKRAFLQVAMSYGYEVWFKEGKAIGYSDIVPEHELFNQVKEARGLLVTAHGREASFTQWKNQELTTVSFSNPLFAPYLRYAIWRTLHSVMTELLPFVYYIHTDGVITNIRLLSRVEKILNSWHMSYAIKFSGTGEIKGVGVYRIGEHQTAQFETVKPVKRSANYVLTDSHDKWWKESFINGLSLRD